MINSKKPWPYLWPFPRYDHL